jgi:uncharacterized protein YdhG (YjbR/CyaY superfamily)
MERIGLCYDDNIMYLRVDGVTGHPIIGGDPMTKEGWQCPQCGRVFARKNQNHTCGTLATVDAYIEAQPPEVRPVLQSIRETIREAAPDAIEKMSWQMPTFWQGENLIHFAAFKKHVSLFPGGDATAAFAEQLKDYTFSKGTIRFPLDKPVDLALIAQITRWRVVQVEGTKE